MGSSGVNPAVSPKSYSKRPSVRVGQDVGSTATRRTRFVRHEREADASEVGPSAATTDHNVGPLLAGEGQLDLGFLTDNRLVQQHVVEHRPQRIVGVRTASRVTDRVADRCTQRPGVLGVVYRAGHDVAAPGLHQYPPVWFLLVRRPHHVDLALEAEERRREAQSAAPLPCTRLRGKPSYPFGLVVERLRDRGVGLVGTSRRDRLVLVVDAGRSAERFFETLRPHQRRWPPQAEDVDDFAGYVDVGFLGHLLADERHGEKRCQVVRPDGLAGGGVKRWLRGYLHVRDHVEPGGGHVRSWQVPAQLLSPSVS